MSAFFLSARLPLPANLSRSRRCRTIGKSGGKSGMAAFAFLCLLASAVFTWPADPKVVADLRKVDEGVAQRPFRASRDSLQHYEVPEWYRDAKFGIFIHWGVYSVPAFGNEWYPRLMYIDGSAEYKHHIATYGTQDKFGYKDFIPMFKADNFDPAAWAELFK